MKLEQIGKYKIVGTIGKGAMGEVFRAHDPVLDRDVAIKVVAGKLAEDEGARKRFVPVFYGLVPEFEHSGQIPDLLKRTFQRGQLLYPLVGREYDRIGGPHGRQKFDDRSTSYGLSAVAYSQAPGWASAIDSGAQMSFAAAFSRFSRDHERQADDLGLRYMTRASYDPQEMPGVFAMLEAVSSKGQGGRAPDWLATHPNPESRGKRSVAAIAELAATLHASG